MLYRADRFIYSEFQRVIRAILLLLPIYIMGSINGLCAQSVHKQPTGVPELFKVIRNGDVPALDELIRKGADVNEKYEGFSPLMASALNGSVKEMEILINNGADVNYKNDDGITALWLAVPDLSKTALLLEHGADVQSISKEGYTVAVKVALFPGSVEEMKLLVSKGANLKKSAADNMLFYNAASTCDTALLTYLVDQGFNVNDSTFLGDYPINIALNYKCFSSLVFLVNHGARVNVSAVAFPLDLLNGITPLMNAAINNDKESFYYLLDHGADPNARSKNGYNVMMYLQQSESDCPEMTTTLIKHGCLPLAKAPDGKDALYFAKLKGNTQSGKILEQYSNK